MVSIRKRLQARSAFWLALTLLPLTAHAFSEDAPARAPISDALWERMQGSSWHPDMGCPARKELVHLTLPYTDYQGKTQRGEMVVNASVADDVIAIFTELHAIGFRIHSMRLVDDFGGSDDRSMEANNTSAFNCRKVAFGTALSAHATGIAIDLNPVENPYVRKGIVLPPSGKDFASPEARRASDTVGLITADGPVVKIFEKRKWVWGGKWRTLKDYQHFSRNGR